MNKIVELHEEQEHAQIVSNLIQDLQSKEVEIKNKAMEIESKTMEIEEQKLLIKYYEEQFKLFQQRLFGAKSEKTRDDAQGTLFNEAETAIEQPVPADDVEKEYIAHVKKAKQKGHKHEQLDKLPQETIEYPLEDGAKICPTCQSDLVHMKHINRRELVIIPATVSVRNHQQEVCVCSHCEKQGTETVIRQARIPKAVIPKSIASSETLAFIITEKYLKHMPLYRIESSLQQFDFTLSRQTMSNWILRIGKVYLEPIYQHMRHTLLEHPVIHADETPLRVIKPNGKPSNRKKCYMWTYGSGYAQTPIQLYEYTETRGQEHPIAFLRGYSGIIQADGYEVYKKIPNTTLIGCMAHVRRKFSDIQKSNITAALPTVEQALSYCNDLFAIEKSISTETIDQRYAVRQQRAVPLLSAFHTWLLEKEREMLPKSAIGKAIAYALNQWKYLENYCLDGGTELSNNRAERAIKPFVIGRKNWLFSYTSNGAETSAIIYSVIETAKANNLKVFDYLVYLFNELSQQNIETIDLAKYTPYSEDLPRYLKIGVTE